MACARPCPRGTFRGRTWTLLVYALSGLEWSALGPTGHPSLACDVSAPDQIATERADCRLTIHWSGRVGGAGLARRAFASMRSRQGNANSGAAAQFNR